MSFPASGPGPGPGAVVGDFPAHYSQTAELTFHNVEYILHAYVRNDALCIETEQKNNGDRWCGAFAARYVEEMTLKTGNFKKFSLFVKMLSTALSRQSDTVFIDLLTYQDLEMLKQRKQQQQVSNSLSVSASNASLNDTTTSTATAPAGSSTVRNQNKRYVILTYVSEFDKVHYPLPLKYELHPDPEALRHTIQRLRSELEMAKTVTGQGEVQRIKQDLARLHEENQSLRTALRVAQQQQQMMQAATGQPIPNVEPSEVCDPEHVSSLQAEIRSLRAQLEARAVEYAAHLSSLSTSTGPSSSHGVSHAEVLSLQATQQALEKQIWTLQDTIRAEQATQRRLTSSHERERAVLMEELDKRTESEREYRTKCRKLLVELDKLRQIMIKAGGTQAAAARAQMAQSSSTTSLSKNSSPSHAGQRQGHGGMPSRASTRTSSTGSLNGSRGSSRSSSRSSSPAPPSGPRGRRATSASSTAPRIRSRSATPPRFDPSAFIRDKEIKLSQTKHRQALERSRAIRDGGRVRSRSRSGSAGSGSDGDFHIRERSRSRSRERHAHTTTLDVDIQQRERQGQGARLRAGSRERITHARPSTHSASSSPSSSLRLPRSQPVSRSRGVTDTDTDTDTDIDNARPRPPVSKPVSGSVNSRYSEFRPGHELDHAKDALMSSEREEYKAPPPKFISKPENVSSCSHSKTQSPSSARYQSHAPDRSSHSRSSPSSPHRDLDRDRSRESAPSASAAPPSITSTSTSTAPTDINDRLQALQNFLKTEKSRLAAQLQH